MLLKFQLLALVALVIVAIVLYKKYGSPMNWLKKLWASIKGLL